MSGDSISRRLHEERGVIRVHQGRVANPRPVASAASVIGCATRLVLILATGLGFATRPRSLKWVFPTSIPRFDGICCSLAGIDVYTEVEQGWCEHSVA